MRSPRDPKPIKLLRKRLDAPGLVAHLGVLAAEAQAIEIRIKGAVGAYSADATAEHLDELGRRLVAGEIVAVQLRFFQDDDWWCDTLMRAGDDFRLVRMRQGEPPAG